MSTQDRIRELEGKIVAVCLSGASRRRCHSRRVRRWLAEIKRLEGEE